MKQLAVLLLLLGNRHILPAQVSNTATLSGALKEQWIQKATALRAQEDYSGAVQQLDSILYMQPADAPVLLFRGDLLLQAKRFAEAATTYKTLLPLQYEPVIVQINLSYALFMNHHPALALQYARKAWEAGKNNTGAIVNYFNAFLWNSKTKEAEQFLQQHLHWLNQAQQWVLKARLYTTAGNYNKGLAYYDSLAIAHPNKYYIQEYAEVLLGKKEINRSATLVKNNQRFFTANEQKAFEEKLKAAQQQNAGTECSLFTDVAGNTRWETTAWWQQRDGRRYRFRTGAGHAQVISEQAQKTSTQFVQLSVTERWNRAWSGETQLQIQRVQPGTEKSFTALTGKQILQYQPNDRRMLGIFYHTEILNFTAALLGKNLRSHNAGYITHLLLSGKTGFYSQGSAGILTDNNRRYQFFGSLYHLLRTEPTLKTGINFSALHFSKNDIKTYFSPNRYLSVEGFADFSTALPLLSRFYFQAQAAGGWQRIEQNNWEPTLRVQTELGLRLKHLETSFKYQTSNVASANGAGYGFNWFTMRAAWRW